MKPGVRLPTTPDNQVLKDLPAGREGVRDTLSYMRAFAEEYKIHPAVRTLALSLVRTLPQKDYAGEVCAVWDYVKNRVRYVRDIRGVETLQTPVKTLEYGQGDCDDKSTLLASMLGSLGHLTRFRAVGFGPRSLCHVLVDVYDGQKWIALETTEDINLGWTPPGVTNEMIEGVNGLGENVFKKLEKKIKKIGSKFDDNVTQKVVKAVGSKAFDTVSSLIATVAPQFGGPMIAASKLVQTHDAKARAKKMASQNERDMQEALEPRHYVLDPVTQQVRTATPKDTGLQQYTVTADGSVTPWTPPTPGFSITASEFTGIPTRPQSVIRPAPVPLYGQSDYRPNAIQWIVPVGAVLVLGLILTR